MNVNSNTNPSPSSLTGEILTLQEVANFLRVNRATVSRFARSGQLRSYKLGSRRLFKREDVRKFLEENIAWEYVSGNTEDANNGNSNHPEA